MMMWQQSSNSNYKLYIVITIDTDGTQSEYQYHTLDYARDTAEILKASSIAPERIFIAGYLNGLYEHIEDIK